MSATGSLFSKTLQDITDTKLTELAKKREAFEGRRADVIVAVNNRSAGVDKLDVLADGVKTCFNVGGKHGHIVRGSTSNARLEIDLQNLYRFLAQARYDPSITTSIIDQWQQALTRHMSLQSVKYTYADLFGQLTTEWLASKQKLDLSSAANEGEDVEMEDFEHVSGGKKMESRLQWEQSVFEATNVSTGDIRKMLKMTFEATPGDSKHLPKAMQKLRNKVREFEEKLMSPHVFTPHTVKVAMYGLLNSDLLGQDKKDLLRDFVSNDTVLKEMADILNMRLQALDEWTWGTAVVVEQRRQLNGTYNIYMDEDLIQAVFLQYLGVKWSVFWEESFVEFRKFKGVWKNARSSVPLIDKKRRGKCHRSLAPMAKMPLDADVG